MTFVYPAVFTPKQNGNGYDVVFPDLEGCTASGPDLEDALDAAREAAGDWIRVELEEEDAHLPGVSHEEDMKLEEGSFMRQIMVIVKLLPEYD